MINTVYKQPPQNHPIRRIQHLFGMLLDAEKLKLVTLHTVVDEIERLIRCDPPVSTLMSPLLVNRFSSLSVIAECEHQLSLYRPWMDRIQDDMVRNDLKVRRRGHAKLGAWLPILEVKLDGPQIYRLGDPSDDKFNYPSHRRRNKQNVDIMRKAEANLDALWKAIDGNYNARAIGKSHNDMIAHPLRSDRAIQRTLGMGAVRDNEEINDDPAEG